MARYAFFIDLSVCAGCESCTVACQNKNEISSEITFTKIDRFTQGTYPNVTSTFLVQQCLHCDNPPCADVCPTGATYKSVDGPVQVDYDKCIACAYCITACPYGARTEDEEAKVVRKCSMCLDRLEEGQEPACVQTCLTRARLVGDLDDPSDPIHEAIALPNTVKVEGTSFYFRLPEGFARDLLPHDFKPAGVTYAWQSILQPIGQLLLAGTAGAVLASIAANAVKATRKGGGENGGH